MNERVAVIGGTGLVGAYLVREWEARGCPVVAATGQGRPSAFFSSLDMRDADAVARFFEATRPTVVAVPAANPHVDYCELHPEETRRVNVDGVLNVAQTCAVAGARMIFYSSDYVFDGEKEGYVETDPLRPLNEYGRQKAAAEEGVLLAGSRNLVVRTSGAYGWQSEPKNLVMQLRARLGKGERMRVTNDIRYNPTYAANLAEVTAELVARGENGIYHAVGSDRLNRLEFARKACGAFGLDEGLLEGVSSAQFNAPARRPRESSLYMDKLERRLGRGLWGADRALRHMAATEGDWLRFSERLPKVSGNLLK